jgi:hypothetical protein
VKAVLANQIASFSWKRNKQILFHLQGSGRKLQVP